MKDGSQENNEENVKIDAVIMSTKDSNFSKNSDEGFEQIQTHEWIFNDYWNRFKCFKLSEKKNYRNWC